MKKHLLNPICQAVGILSLVTSPVIAQEAETDGKKARMNERGMRDKMQKFTKLIAMIHPVGESGVNGSVAFEKAGDGVKVTANIRGLEPNSKHGFHVHEFGDLGSADASSAGDHFNPEGHEHALPDKETRHAGDLGNIEADGDGNAMKELTVKNIKLGSGPHGILGRAVIIHSKADDGGQPSGNSGDRIAAGIIGISKDGVPMGDRNNRDATNPGRGSDDQSGTQIQGNQSGTQGERNQPGAQGQDNPPATQGQGNQQGTQGQGTQPSTGGPDYKPGTGNTSSGNNRTQSGGGAAEAPENPGNKPGTAPSGAADAPTE